MAEQNFESLQDPVFANVLFRKCPRRIEALGLVSALLIWSLMERGTRLNMA